jgi:hypothetical protein
MNKPRAYTDPQDSPQPGLGGGHHLPPYSIIYAWPQGLHSNVILFGISKLGVSKLGLPQLWKPTTFCADLQLRWGLKQSYNLRWNIFNDMWHATYMQINQGDSWLLMVGSQINTLIPNLFFGHMLCFKYSNESHEPILNIYISRTF